VKVVHICPVCLEEHRRSPACEAPRYIGASEVNMLEWGSYKPLPTLPRPMDDKPTLADVHWAFKLYAYRTGLGFQSERPRLPHRGESLDPELEGYKLACEELRRRIAALEGQSVVGTL
jgi:hypothetical protein